MKLLKTYDWQVPKGVIAFGPGMSLAIGSPDSQHKHLEPARWVKACWTSGERWFGCPVSEPFLTEAEALAELDRIAALISGTAPAQGWVKGAPPEDGKWYLAMHATGSPVAVRYRKDPGAGLFRNIIDTSATESEPWRDINGAIAATSTLTHHLPTPIVLP